MIKSALRSSLSGDKKYTSTLAGNIPSNEYLISTAIVSGSSTASVSFDVSAFNGIYKHLYAVVVCRSSINVNGDDFQMRFNNDSTYTNYRSHYMYGSGSSAQSATLQSTQFPGINLSINTADASHTANVFGSLIVEMPDIFSSTKNKTVSSFGGMSQAGTANFGITLQSGCWFLTTPVTSIQFYPYPGTSPYIAAGTRISLYGVTT
jgi:hypothetical protein